MYRYDMTGSGSYHEHYSRHAALGGSAERRSEARRRFLIDVAERVVAPNISGVAQAGSDWVQIDEPAATTRPDEVPLHIQLAGDDDVGQVIITRSNGWDGDLRGRGDPPIRLRSPRR